MPHGLGTGGLIMCFGVCKYYFNLNCLQSVE